MGWGCPWHMGPAVCTHGDVFCSCVCTYACMETSSALLLASARATVLLQLPWPLRERTWQDAAMDVGAGPGQAHVSLPWCRSSLPPLLQSHGDMVPAWYEPTAAGMWLYLYKRVVY